MKRLPKFVIGNRRVALICSHTTAESALSDADGFADDRYDADFIKAIGRALNLPAEMRHGGFQRLRAGSAAALLIGSFDGEQRTVTGTLSMLLQRHGLRQARAAAYEKRVASGAVLVCVSCAGLPGDACEIVYDALARSISQS